MKIKNLYPIVVQPPRCVMPLEYEPQMQWLTLRCLYMENRLERFLKILNAQIQMQSLLIDLSFPEGKPVVQIIPQPEGELVQLQHTLQHALSTLEWTDFIDSFLETEPPKSLLDQRKAIFAIIRETISTYLFDIQKGGFFPTEVAYFTMRQQPASCYYCLGLEVHLFDPLKYVHLQHNEFFIQSFRAFYKEMMREYSELMAKPDVELTMAYLHLCIEQSQISMSEKLRYYGEKRFLKVLQSVLDGESRRPAFPLDIIDTLNMISSLTYESAAVRGQMLICRKEAVTNYLQLSEPIPLEKVRRVRKLLQTSTSRVYLLCDGWQVYGMTQNATKPDDAVEIVFKHTLFWQVNVYNGGERETVLQMNNSIPQIVSVRLNEQKIEEAYAAVFGYPISKNMALTIRQARKQDKGTMLVIMNKAEQEASRLRGQSFSIENNQKLTRKLVQSLTMVDGALLLDTDSYCHAFGVILDGIASEDGDITRGARYNAAIKYLSLFQGIYPDGQCLIIVISEDNLVDVIGTA